VKGTSASLIEGFIQGKLDLMRPVGGDSPFDLVTAFDKV
jgi:hypothetical protein